MGITAWDLERAVTSGPPPRAAGDLLHLAPHPVRPDDMLWRLGERLAERGAHVELVVLGASALVFSGFVSRPTYDIDILAVLLEGELLDPAPLPPELLAAQERVMLELDLETPFLDLGVPEYMLALGLPDGLSTRLVPRRYGPGLTIHGVSRFDHIHFKFMAMIENNADRAKHEADLRALDPTEAELWAAVGWGERLIRQRIQRAQMILQEQLLRDGRRGAGLLGLLAFRLAPASPRYRLGAWLMKRPRWCGRAYGPLVSRGGRVRRGRRARLGA